jgi:eukaryotic-like serine/threonine-protein kinase
MKCPKCQSENADTAKFCIDCGQPLQTDLVCPHCNHVNKRTARFCEECGQALSATQTPVSDIKSQPSPAAPTPPAVPASFGNGRYQVKKFLGEGGKKKVYLAHDTVLDRDVAFALIKTEKLDETARTRIKREAQAMGRLGDHPNIVTVYDFGEAPETNQPYMVLPLLSGGDVEGLIKKAADHKLPMPQSVEIARSVCKGLEFAHARGIIHRDIKPGNVWMSADGTAKVGDFGLAVAVDRSRLTQVGMMVGTVSYMPPEQAMGGEVTARADLYSFGAMLYEMVTGRPPFVGDDSVAIIGQHINTPPVSPSWHRADLPPSLETLIMQLLEKDPQKRPSSAKVVLEALESIASTKGKPEAATQNAVPSENPLYRRVFVGREQELKQLQAAFDGAVSGQGGLWMVLGEPGIGKTAICEQLATYVTLRGGKTLVGHCYEEGSLSLPYLAFVEAMRSYVLDRQADDLRKDLGSGATDVARIVSEIREKLDVKPRVAENPEEDRYRLLQSVTGFLTNAAAIKPLLVVLEDLHDADKGTLEMLTYFSRNLGGARLLVVGTYRDVEVDRTHPLSAALAELRRVATFGRVLLRGLNADEVRRMLESITRESVPWSVAEAVHRQTEGNPLFVQEVVRYLNEEGLLKREGGRWTSKGATPLEMSIPEGLRDVIGKRLSKLSKECNQLLSVASVIGREFAIETLKAMSPTDDAVFLKALKEAVQLSVLEERSKVGRVRYRFTHAFLRQTLYEEMIAPQRLRLHQQVARALETIHARNLEEHAAELAEHFSQSTDPADLAKAVKYGEMAARRAADVYAYGEAVRLLDQALKVQEILDPEDKAKRCELLLELCKATFSAPDHRRIVESVAPETFSLAESIGDNSKAALVCTYAIWATFTQSGMVPASQATMRQWVERCDRYAEPGSVERVYADAQLASSVVGPARQLELQSRLRLSDQALELARRLNDLDALLYCYWRGGSLLQVPRLCTKWLLQSQEFMSLLQSRGGNPILLQNSLRGIASAFLASGKRERVREVLEMLREYDRRIAGANWLLPTLELDSVESLMDGRLHETLEMSERIRIQGEEMGTLGGVILQVRSGGMRAHIYRGVSPDELERWHPGFWDKEEMWAGARQSLVLAHWGQFEKASEILDRDVVGRQGIGTDDDATMTWMDTFFLESSVLSGHRIAAELLYNRLNVPGLCTNGTDVPTCIPRHLGGAAALVGRYDDARRHYQEAIGVCTEMRFRPELALSRLQLAELLLDHYPGEKKDAQEHLDFAIKEFREMKMQPSLERALRRKEILKA